MSNAIKLEVEISLQDFFSNENERAEVFQNALQQAISERMRDSQWVQQNIAYYIFSRFTDEVFKVELDAIKDRIAEKIAEFKGPDDWTIKSHSKFEGFVGETLAGMENEIKSRTIDMANKIMADESDKYNSFYNKVADEMAQRVMDNFISAMVKKENSK